MLTFNEFVAYCRTLDGEELPTAGKQTTFTVRASEDRVVFVPTGKEPQERLRPRNTEAVLAKLAVTGDYAPGAYAEETRQASYILGVMARYRDEGAAKHLSLEVLRRVSAVHVWEAVQRLLAGESPEPFVESTNFDLLTDDDERLPPKAVFGIALSAALSRPILPAHFSGGEGSPCFDILRSLGYRVIPKNAEVSSADSVADEFPEGMKFLRTHARRERSPAAARAKKADFVARFGALGCERCGEDFSAKYGTANADACIEVHHAKLAVTDMPPGYKTKLVDLQCLCANCHRVVHFELRNRASAEANPPDARTMRIDAAARQAPGGTCLSD
jgi:hypothetical protein